MRLVLTYSKRKKNSWLRVYDDFDGMARLAIRMSGWTEHEKPLASSIPKEVCKILLQPGLKRTNTAISKVSYPQWQKNRKALVDMLKPLGIKVEGPFKKSELDQAASLAP